MSPSHWGTQDYLYGRCGLISADWKEENTSPSPAGNTPHSSQGTPGYQHIALQQGHIASSHSASCPPGPPGSFLQSCSVPNIIAFNKQCGLNLEIKSLFQLHVKFHLAPSKRLWWVTRGLFWMLFTFRVAHTVTDTPWVQATWSWGKMVKLWMMTV